MDRAKIVEALRFIQQAGHCCRTITELIPYLEAGQPPPISLYSEFVRSNRPANSADSVWLTGYRAVYLAFMYLMFRLDWNEAAFIQNVEAFKSLAAKNPRCRHWLWVWQRAQAGS